MSPSHVARFKPYHIEQVHTRELQSAANYATIFNYTLVIWYLVLSSIQNMYIAACPSVL